MCVGVEDISTGLVLPESADGGGWFVVGTSPAYTTHTDCLHFYMPVPVEHSTGVPLFGRRQQRGERRYVGLRLCLEMNVDMRHSVNLVKVTTEKSCYQNKGTNPLKAVSGTKWNTCISESSVQYSMFSKHQCF